MKKTILIVLIIVVVIGAGYYFWMHRYKYFFQGDDPYELKEEGKNDLMGRDEIDESIEMEDFNETDENEDDEDWNDEIYDSPAVTEKDCGNKCVAFENEEEKEYCMEICGFTEGQRYVSDCGELEYLKKDVCFKQKAIDNKDQNYCDKIINKNLRENCRNRVLEEILD